MLKITLQQFNKFRTIYSVTKRITPKNERLLSSYTPHIYKTKESHDNYTKKSHSSEDGEYLVRIQNNPEVFGVEPPRRERIDEDDVKEDEHLSQGKPTGMTLSTKQYADMIKALIRKKKIKEAIDVVEVKMLQEDKVKPENYLYNLLMGACGRVGYTKKAFQLFNDMKKRGLVVHAGAYTALFNACANSPWPEDGLTRTKQLHNLMIESMHQPNDSNYHAMIKAYGRCGDINTAFSLVDEMFAKKFPIKDDTMNFLFQACINDKEAGFRHALLVWHKFLRKRIKPSVFSFNLLLRATRDCGLGDLDCTRDVFKTILPPTDRFFQIKADQILIESNESQPNTFTDLISEDNNVLLQTEEIKGGILDIADGDSKLSFNRPNLLAAKPELGDIMLINEIKKSEDRLLLLGGASNVLQEMEKHQCKPDIKTFTQLLNCLPSTLVAENELLVAMKKSKVQPDLDFYNMLIKKRSMRFDYISARNILDVIHDQGYQPDIITYGVLALGCKNKEEAENFLQEMEAGRYRLNTEILGAMLQQSTFHFDFHYVMFVMERCVQENIQPNAIFMERLDKFYNKCKKLSNDHTGNLGKTKKFQKGFQIFRMRYKTWKGQVTPEQDVHPWQQFRQPVETDTSHYTEDKSSRFKPRLQSKFREKKIPTEIVKTKPYKKFIKFKPKHQTNTKRIPAGESEQHNRKNWIEK